MNYKDVKIAALERKIRMLELQATAKQIDDAFAKVMTENGLDPARNYTLNDAAETATPLEPETPAEGL